MADEALTQWLGRAVRRGLLTPDQASKVKEIDLPLANPANPKLTDEALREAVRELVTLVRNKAPTDFDESMATVAAWRLRTLLQAHERVQDEAEKKHAVWAMRLAGGAITLAAWQKLMQQQAVKTLAMQTVLGKQRMPNLIEREEANQLLRRENTFLAFFADDIAAKEAKGEPLSEGQIRARSNLYTGAGRGEFYRGYEQLPANRKGIGWVAEYIAKDDKATCQPCHRSQGFWLPGEGPWPGQVCEGRSNCRCRRVLVYNPDEWRKLMARQ